MYDELVSDASLKKYTLYTYGMINRVGFYFQQ